MTSQIGSVFLIVENVKNLQIHFYRIIKDRLKKDETKKNSVPIHEVVN